MTVRFEEKKNGVWRAVVDRPEKKNAIDAAAMSDLEELVGKIETSATARVLVLRGEGDAFVSGGDLDSFAEFDSQEDVAAMSRRMKQLLMRLERLSCWTVAAINGAAFGGGCELALAFDMRVCAERARFGFVQSKYAIPPGWGGLTRLVETVGRSRAMLWLGTAAIIGSEEAAQAGLVDSVAPPLQFSDHLDNVVSRLAKTSPQLIATLKEGARRAETKPRKEALDAELEPFCRLWMEGDHKARIAAVMERKKDGAK